MQPHKTDEFQAWAGQFVAQERQAGRTYQMIPAPREPSSTCVENRQLCCSNYDGPAEIGGRMMDFMRHEAIMPTDPSHVEEKAITLAMAIMTYIRDIDQQNR